MSEIIQSLRKGPFRFALVLAILSSALMFLVISPGPVQAYVCGDANNDGNFDVGDVVFMIDFIFRGGQPPDPSDQADANGDCTSNIGDAVCMLNHIFREGPALICPRCSFTSDLGDCKLFAEKDSITENLDCIEYQYDGTGTLHIKHTNAHLNCCAKGINLTVTINEFSLIIREKEFLPYGECDCLCFFDIEYTIEGIPPGFYLMQVIDEDMSPGQESLQVMVDFSEPRAGIHCVEQW